MELQHRLRRRTALRSDVNANILTLHVHDSDKPQHWWGGHRPVQQRAGGGVLGTEADSAQRERRAQQPLPLLPGQGLLEVDSKWAICNRTSSLGRGA